MVSLVIMLLTELVENNMEWIYEVKDREVTMNPAFNKLQADKQKNIIEAAMKEFSENGYEKASTNRIVKKAGIGKGTLFYYFKNKEELYQYVLNSCLDNVFTELLNKINTGETDFIERLKQIAKIKALYHLTYPYDLSLLGTAFLQEENAPIPPSAKQKYEQLVKRQEKAIYDNIDYSLFRKDLDPDKAFRLIQWTLYGYQEELTQRLKHQDLSTIDLDPYWEEFYSYVDELKKVYYEN